MRCTAPKSPEASLMPRMLRCSASRAPGLRRDVHAGAGGDIVEDYRTGDGVGQGGIVADQSRLGGFVVVGGYHQQSVRTGALGVRLRITAFSVELDPDPAITGTRPATYSTQNSMVRIRSR